MTEQQQLARGKNIMLSLFEKRLSVPRMYLDADWQGKTVDILAIDRDGSGDVHIVLAYLRPMLDTTLPDLREDRARIGQVLERLSHINAQYKYILGVATTSNWKPFGDQPVQDLRERTFSPDGLGRVGIAFAAPDQDEAIGVNLVTNPERFRAFVGASADDFVKKHLADWEIRA